MNRKRGAIFSVIVLAAAFFCVLGGTVLAVIFANRLPSIDEQLAEMQNGGTMAVTLVRPLRGQTIVTGGEMQVFAEAVGANNISSLVLWADGAVVAATSAPGDATTFSASWTWRPTEVGDYTLFVRGHDIVGNIIDSNDVTIHVVEPAIAERTVIPEPEQDVISVSGEVGVPPEVIIEANPGIEDPTAKLPPDQPISIPVPVARQPGAAPGIEPPPPGGGGGDGSGDSPEDSLPTPGQAPDGAGQKDLDDLVTWIESNAPSDDSMLPAVPQVAAQVDGCNVVLTITKGQGGGDELGFLVYRKPEGRLEAAIELLATVKASSDGEPIQYTDVAVYGEFRYIVSASNNTGASFSDPVNVTVEDTVCLTVDWMELEWSTFEVATEQPPDTLYCYVSRDGGPWTRVPWRADFIVPNEEGVFDLAPHLPSAGNYLSQEFTLDIECLGWQGDTLVDDVLVAQVPFSPDGVGQARQVDGETGGQISVELALAAQDGEDCIGCQISAAVIPEPNVLDRTYDPAVCANHYPAGQREAALDTCKTAISGDQSVVLTWNWATASCWPGPDGSVGDCKYYNDIDGFHIYEVSGGDIRLVDSTPANKTVFTFPRPWPRVQGSEPYQYMVVAYANDTDEYGDLVSSPSNIYALSDFRQELLETIVIEAKSSCILTLVDNTWDPSKKRAGCDGSLSTNQRWPLGQATVERRADKCGANTTRASITFDLSELKWRTIWDASFSFELVDSHFYSPYEAMDGPVSCAQSLGYWEVSPTAEWDFALLESFSRFGPMKSTTDVTSLVADRVHAPPHTIGFIIHPGYNRPAAGQCLSHYGNFRLTISVFPKD
jgi:hypothetical protein